jgi:hypothetical protein
MLLGMFFRLSAVSRLIVLQTLLVLLTIITVVGGLKFTGRGKYVDPDERDTAYSVANYAPVAGFMRDHGWMLLAVPFALAVVRLRQVRWSTDPNSEPLPLVAIAGCCTVALIALGIYASRQAFEDNEHMYLTGQSRTIRDAAAQAAFARHENRRPPRDY